MDDEDTVAVLGLILDVANQVPDSNVRYKIMYKTIFDNPQLKRYWQLLIEKELLDYDSHTQTFKPTERGQRFLQAYNNKMDNDALSQ